MQAQLKRAGQDAGVIPDAPVLSYALSFYYDAFFDLCTTRVNGMGIGPISVLAIDQYAYNRHYNSFQLYFLRRVIRELDPIYMEHMSSESKGNKKRRNSK